MIAGSWRFNDNAESRLRKKFTPSLQEKIENTKIKIMPHKKWRIRSFIDKNLDLKSPIINYFICSVIFNFLIFVVLVLVNIFYTTIFLWGILKLEIKDLDSSPHLKWEGILIINVLITIFGFHLFSDCYKLSLRKNYRFHYLKPTLLFFDILSLNFWNVLASLTFLKNSKNQTMNFDNIKLDNELLNYDLIKKYFKEIIKIEIIPILASLISFLGGIIVGYFVKDNYPIAFLCLGAIGVSLFYLFGWGLLRIISITIGWNMFSELLKTNSYDVILSLVRFLSIMLSPYYAAVFINLIVFDENIQEKIIQEF